MNIGVLAIQGSIQEHVQMLRKLSGILVTEVKDFESLQSVDGIILPGGESTTMGKLLRDFHLLDPLKKRIQAGLPVWGTCAGMILLAKNISDEQTVHLGVLDALVKRNAYGSQLDSFVTEKVIRVVSETPLKLVFIRAPFIKEVTPKVKVLATHHDKIIAAQQNNILATSFHPELTADPTFHSYFLRMCQAFKKS